MTPTPLPIPTRPTGQVLAARPVRSMFLTDPDTVAADGVADKLHRIGITHLEMQVYHRDGPATVDEWIWTEGQKVLACQGAGFRLVGLGDCAFRTPYRQSEAMVRYVARQLRDSGIVDGIEMVDECRNDPAYYQPEEYIRWWREEGGPPIAWPGMMPFKMETDALSDYNSRYWDAYLMPNRDMLEISRLIGVYGATQPRLYRPLNILVWCADASYNGRTLVYAGVTAQQVVAQAWIAMAFGASGIRMYAYDAPFWRAARAVHARGQQQTGSRPGDDRWPGVCEAFLTLKKYDAALRLPCYEPVKSGPFLWGRRGDAGQGAIVWAVNVSDEPHDLPHGLGRLVSGGVKWWDMMELMRK